MEQHSQKYPITTKKLSKAVHNTEEMETLTEELNFKIFWGSPGPPFIAQASGPQKLPTPTLFQF